MCYDTGIISTSFWKFLLQWLFGCWLGFFSVGWFVCLEALLWKELFICTETGLLSIKIYLDSFIVVLGVLWIVSGKSVAVKWAEYVSVTVTCAGR